MIAFITLVIGKSTLMGDDHIERLIPIANHFCDKGCVVKNRSITMPTEINTPAAICSVGELSSST
jgi:hypothetical protein